MDYIYDRWLDRVEGYDVHAIARSPAEQIRIDTSAALPRNVSLMLELDLQGIKPPKLLPLSEVPPATLQTQMPETAQIFLCSSHKDARFIFELRQIESSVRYVERVNHQRNGLERYAFQSNNTSSADEDLLMPYDPRCLLGWLSIQPGQVHKVLLSEYAMIPSERRMNQLVVRSQIHIIRGAGNHYTAVWFDFRDQYDVSSVYKFNVPGEEMFGVPDEEKVGVPDNSVPASIWQRRFACRFLERLNEPIRHAMDFPSFLLLELLKTDITIFEKFILLEQELLPVDTLAPVVTKHLDNRLAGLEFTQSIIRKAEEMHRFVTHMSDPRVLDLIAKEFRANYQKTLYRLEIGSSLLVSQFKHLEEVADKRLDVYNRFAQQRQALSLSALTYCAAFFLPLSLAGTFLSMQSRAIDLHLIVYDFCGITSVFCTLAAFIYFLSWAWSHVKTIHLNRRLKKGKTRVPPLGGSLSTQVICGVAWISMVCSFLVGMLHNLRLGLIMLSVPAALIGLTTIYFFGLGLYWGYHVMKATFDEYAKRGMNLMRYSRERSRLRTSSANEPSVA